MKSRSVGGLGNENTRKRAILSTRRVMKTLVLAGNGGRGISLHGYLILCGSKLLV